MAREAAFVSRSASISHHDAGEVFDGDNVTVDEIAKELGGARAP